MPSFPEEISSFETKLDKLPLKWYTLGSHSKQSAILTSFHPSKAIDDRVYQGAR
jgi:hypothetical protein